ncbi:MAG: protein translocase subunit SecD [Ignavibacteriales bacterium]|nr:protein translocase subunit SecD [Ignavibacteriales bacterium]
MRNQLSRILLILAAVVVSLVFLYPTYQDYQYRKKLASLAGQDSVTYLEQNQDAILSARLKRLKLGLDLQGGMRVVLEVDVIQLLDDLAKNKDDNFRSIVKEIRSQTTTNDESVIPMFGKKFADRGIRMSRYYGNIRDTDNAILAQLDGETARAVDRAIEIVRNRVDQYRVSEPNIQKQGTRRIIVELPGVKDEREVQSLLQGTARLEFRLLKDAEVTYRVMKSIDDFLSGKVEGDTTAGAKTAKKEEKPKDALEELLGNNKPTTSDTTQEAQVVREHPFFAFVQRIVQNPYEGYVLDKNRDRVTRLLARPDVQRLIPADIQFLWSARSELSGTEGNKFYRLFVLKRQPELTGEVIVDARASVNPDDNRPVVNMEMNSEGSREWARITGANINKRIAIVLDNAVFSAPNVINKIAGGHSQITNMESPNEAKLLEIVLKAGALPAPVSIIEQRSVGPSLGEDSVRSGLNSTALAFILTVLFMLFYYHNAGATADIALLFNILFLLGVMAGFAATLTLPGIAGIVLTLGIAVDANVLINERVREELAGGKTLRAAIDAGYARAFTAIVDSNVTTFLTGVVLYQFGSGPVQGFALTLMIGIVASMFSAIIITRVIFNIMMNKGLNPNFG